MSRINPAKVVVGGLVAGFVMNAVVEALAGCAVYSEE